MGQMKINSRSFVEDVRSGLSEFDLMEKYGLSEKQLSVVFERLLDSGKLSTGDLEPQPQFEGTMVVASTCVACGALKFVDSGSCPQCGMINPGSPVTATTKIADPTSLVEGIKSRRVAAEETTTIQTAVKDAAVGAEPDSARDKSREEFSTEIESWIDPVTEELSASSKMWGEPHEDMLPSDEELWAGGPDVVLTGLPEARPAQDGKALQAASAPAAAEAIADKRLQAGLEGPDTGISRYSGASPDDGDATELLPLFHTVGPPSKSTTGRTRMLRLAAGLGVLAVVCAAGFFFFGDITGLILGGSPAAPAHTALVNRPAPAPAKVEEPKQPTPPTPSTQVSPKSEPIEQHKVEQPPGPPQEPAKSQPGAIEQHAAASPSVPSVKPDKVRDPLPPSEPQSQKTAVKIGINVDALPRELSEEAKSAPAASEEHPETKTTASAGTPVEAVKNGNPDAELIPAIDNEEVKRVRSLLSLGADPNATDRKGVTALIHAVETGNESLVRTLLERGADVAGKGPDGSGPLESALRKRDMRVARLILSRSRDAGTVGLLEASRKGDRASLDLLLEGGANVNGTGTMGETPLMVAAGAGQIETVKLLLERGADPRLADKKGVNALGWARSPVSLGAVPLRVQREVVQILKTYTGR